jgi:putrescine aminotransferase
VLAPELPSPRTPAPQARTAPPLPDLTTSARTLELTKRHLSRGRATLGDMFGGHVEVAAEGAWLTMASGERFLNAGSYGVLILGSRHPAVESAVIDQIRRRPIASRLFLDVDAALSAEALARRTPPGLEHVHWVGSGAEATETAIKMARSQGRTHLVSTVGGYHGKTMGALSVTGRELYQAPFRPLLPEVSFVPYGDADALEAELAVHGDRACLIIEPIQGEAGVVLPPPGYLKRAEELCRATGAFFVVDEILTGLGRLGSWWGCDVENVRPDVLLVGKGLSGGVVPVAAAVATEQAYSAFNRDPFIHTSTFAGSPIAMAAARAAVETIDAEGIPERARVIGNRLGGSLCRSVARHAPHLVRAVRGRGLLWGIEFGGPGLAGEMLLELIARNVVVNHSLNAHSVLRLTPPAVLTDSDLDHLESALDDSLRALAARYTTADQPGAR